jgi:hypothetical protein
MSHGPFQALIHRLRRVVNARGDDGLTDAELLGRFVSRRDDGAFELLMWRHVPMVLATCRRVLGTHADAEDAFQATAGPCSAVPHVLSHLPGSVTWSVPTTRRTLPTRGGRTLGRVGMMSIACFRLKSMAAVDLWHSDPATAIPPVEIRRVGRTRDAQRVPGGRARNVPAGGWERYSVRTGAFQTTGRRETPN